MVARCAALHQGKVFESFSSSLGRAGRPTSGIFSAGPCFASVYSNSCRRALSLLNHCPSMAQLKQIQSHFVVCGTLFDPIASHKIITFCVASDSGDHRHAYELFTRLPHRNTYAWNTMIRGFAEGNEPAQAVLLYKQMLQGGTFPNNYTFSFLLGACGDLCDHSLGFLLHAQVIKLGWGCHHFVQNGLIHLYASCKRMDSARRLFDAYLDRDVVTWTSLVNGYIKSGEILIARQLFDEMPARSAISWSSMINGYVEAGLFKEALELFYDMQRAGFRPNHAGIVSALTACTLLGALDLGRWIHSYVDRNGMELDRVLGTSLIDMYAKCGCIDMAAIVFEQMPYRDVFAFTSLISGRANHNQGLSALKLFNRMKKEGIVPNEVTFICVLNACCRMGLVEEGLKIFGCMSKYFGLEPGIEHYSCLVNLLGRAGMLEEAKKVVREMPMEPDHYVLGALLNSCRIHGQVELGRETVSLVRQDVDHSWAHLLLSNMYASANKWNDMAKARKGMEEMKVRKVPGCSLIEVNGAVHEFVAGHCLHEHMGKITSMLHAVDMHLKFVWLNEDDGPVRSLIKINN